ncbi:MAG: methyltransferase domain-containing protein [Firmicutes bacterium]|nr:methyltransferase domain-containing protein [[Eubacterium] siraeum]MCM1488363.1 methyltransferase domain-containing protein [Bacillota bacterium]
MTDKFICPVCGSALSLSVNTLRCENNHCFDVSKSGYVNLLTKGGKKGHGDDKLMVRARRNFLQKDYYGHLKNAVCGEAEKYLGKGCFLLDSGCGEGYYTSGLYGVLSRKQGGGIYGADVSKEALKIAAKACPEASFAVASAYRLPFSEKSFDLITSLFAPLASEEFHRVLKDNGIFITVIPLENHLWELKKAVYDTPYKNKPENTDLKGFELISSCEVKKEIGLSCNEDIKNLFMMTPYYYKTSQRDQQKLNNMETLTVKTEFLILTYKKIT